MSATKLFHLQNEAALSHNFEVVFKTHYKRLCLYVYQFVHEKSTSEDIVQNSFLKVWTKRQNIDFNTPTALLYKIVKDETINYLKSKKRITSSAAFEELPDDDTFRRLIYAETINEISALAEKLPPKCRNIFHQIFIEGKNNDEIALHLKIAESTVRKQKEKALRFLKAAYHYALLTIISMLNSFI